MSATRARTAAGHRCPTRGAGDLEWSAQLNTAHPEGQRERPDEAPATARSACSRAADRHGANSVPAASRRGKDEEEASRMTPSAPRLRPRRLHRRARPSARAARLSCRECGARATRSARATPAPSASARSRSPTTSAPVTREPIEAGPQQHLALRGAAARARRRCADIPNLEPGCTQLVRADNLARELGHAARCGSRTTAATRRTRSRTAWSPSPLAAARELGFTTLACPSTGNLANAVAAAAARAGHPLGRARSPPTSSSRRSSRPRCTAARWSPSRATTTTSTGSRSELAGEQRGLGVRQRQRPALLRRGLQDAGLRGRRAARLAAAASRS